MDDIMLCPICGNKFTSRSTYTSALDPEALPIKKVKRHCSRAPKPSNYIERTCTNMNHSLLTMVNKNTNKIDFIKMSLNHKYSRYIEIDFYHQKCRVSCMKDGNSEYIEIPKMILPDFPDLVKLRERVGLYVVFS